jgi:hypothetical protein
VVNPSLPSRHRGALGPRYRRPIYSKQLRSGGKK